MVFISKVWVVNSYMLLQLVGGGEIKELWEKVSFLETKFVQVA